LWIPLALILAFAAYWGYERLPIEQVMQGAAAAQAQISDMVQLPELAAPTATPVQGDEARPTQVTPSPSPTRTPTATPSRPPSATPSPTPTATATGGAREYVVQSGDSLALIGEKLNISWQTIATLNGLTAYSMLQPGDKLRLPTLTPAPTRATATTTRGTVRPTEAAATATASATPTRPPAPASPTPTATALNNPTPAVPTATPRPLPTFTYTPIPSPTATPAPAMAAPILTNPGDQGSYSGETAQIVLEWQPAPGTGLPSGAFYRVTILYTEKGTEVAQQPPETTATGMRVPLWLWGLADQPARKYAWFVQIVQRTTDGKGGTRLVPLSLPSEKRTFYWN
jgi:LysM repeat protein